MFKKPLKNAKIVEKFKYLIIISLVVIVAGAIMLIASGMNVGLDFTGGAKIEIELLSFADDDIVKDGVDSRVSEIFRSNGLIQQGAMQPTTGSDGTVTYEFRLRYYHNGNLDKEGEQEFINFVNTTLTAEIFADISDYFANDSQMSAMSATIDSDNVRAFSVGPTATSALLSNAMIAVIVAIVVMLIYIIIRFTLSSALASICALLHDVLIMIALTVIFGVPVNSTFIAAVITIIGYSINASIVIFDRIREELKVPSNADKSDAQIANESIVKTLTRTVLTTITTLLMVVILAILSVPSIQEFILPIIFGLLAGTFSSVLVAPSLWVIFRRIGKKINSKREAKKGYSGLAVKDK